tara:strand:- start:434 stop:850 length:417 start_codon:yes stop_codon:yes gene_type:complete
MSEILVDNLTGKTSAGDITVTSEGGDATQSLQQGLAKAWANFNGTGTIAVRDSLNVSSLNDDGTGKYDVVLTSNMNNANYSAIGIGAFNSSDSAGQTTGQCRRISPATNLFGVRGHSVSASVFDDIELAYGLAHGDLA